MDSLQKIKQDLENINDSLSSANLVMGRGSENAEVIFVGEAPGKEEDEQGLPFVGRAGKQLSKFLEKAGFKEDDIYITNIVKYRPPGNRDPTKEEIERYAPYLKRQINLIKPKIICTLGNHSTKIVLSGFRIEKLDDIKGISKLRGRVNNLILDDKNYKVIPLYHPAATLYNRSLESVFEKDLLLVKQESSQKSLF